MNRKQRNLPRWDGMLGFSLVAVLLSAVLGAGAAAAQQGNTAYGTGALASNTTGTEDSAFGFGALFRNTAGNDNTASGYEALYNNTIGYYNTAIGIYALLENTKGSYNTACGDGALGFNTIGYSNTASGYGALNNNTTGKYNTASGVEALYSNTTGDGNTASDYQALLNNAMGNSNIGLGYGAGYNIVAGSNNIDIGSGGIVDESNTIRIGLQGTQSATYIAGISDMTVSVADAVVSSNGQLGVATSSARYKRDIHDMGGASACLMKLRPVSFRYKSDPSETLQYGLVAEEVARVYPELVTRDTDGKLQSVRYLEFTALLLNELKKQAGQLQKQTNQLQKQAKKTQELAERLETKDWQLAAQQREIDALKQQNASINGLSERLAALKQQVRTPQELRSLASK